MRHLFDPAIADETRARIERLRPDSPRQWGKMNASQMLAHCTAGVELSLGERTIPRMWLGRLIGGFVKRSMMRTEQPMRRNSPTDASLVTHERDCDFAAEQRRLLGAFDRFVAGGPGGCTTAPHFFFGPMTPAEWSALQYQHLDHHLRQFGG